MENREQFLAERKGRIGGSDAPVILGLSSFKTPLQLWMEMTGRLAPQPDSALLRRGRKLEPVVISEYEEETGRSVTKGSFEIHPERPWQSVHLDGTIAANEHEGLGALEAKSANVFRIKEWDTEAPLLAQVQLQHGLSVTGLQWGSVAGLLGGLEFRWQDFERNNAFIDRLVEHEIAFMSHVTSDTPPDPVAADSSMLGRVWEMVEGSFVNLPDEAEQWDLDRLRAKSEMARLKEIVDELDSKLKFAIGPNEMGVLPNGSAYTFKSRKGYEVKAHYVEPTRVLARRK